MRLNALSLLNAVTHYEAIECEGEPIIGGLLQPSRDSAIDIRTLSDRPQSQTYSVQNLAARVTTCNCPLGKGCRRVALSGHRPAEVSVTLAWRVLAMVSSREGQFS
jgi:hypothetical protein